MELGHFAKNYFNKTFARIVKTTVNKIASAIILSPPFYDG
nr:MAG TPA: hypothetical protein [Caudoviricetes sp.]